MSPIHQPDLQRHSLRLYGELLCRRTDWGGQLAFAAFPDAASSGLAAAASIAGAASLTVDSDSATMKAHFRDGAYDFVVNTLDEALRALKNEIRRGRSIAIGLIADPQAVLTEASERGLSSQAVFTRSSEAAQVEQSIVAHDGFILPVHEQSHSLTEWLQQKGWVAKQVDQPISMSDLPEGDSRRRWLQRLPAHQRSSAKEPRWMWTEEKP